MGSRVEVPLRGRGAVSNRSGRYESLQRRVVDDGWGTIDQPIEKLTTTIDVDRARTVIAYNQSPDIAFDRSINPYRGCEHGCVYCYARPTHARFGFSPGQDFESRLFYKPDIAARLERELSAPGYRVAPVAIGANTDAYQPIERKFEVTRDALRVLAAHHHPCTIITKSALVERDLDILAPMAAKGLASVAVSITTLDRHLARRLEPRAAAPARRLETVRRLRASNVPVTVMIAPLIPALNEPELETLVAAARDADANAVRYILLRLPLELTDLFDEWLQAHYPLKRDRVLANLRDTRGGKLYDSSWHQRMRGQGPLADLIEDRFRLAERRAKFPGSTPLDTSRFLPNPGAPTQLGLGL
ncbi:MAG: PA0069 family radical SAM protein [Pseudomonadota bacterium]